MIIFGAAVYVVLIVFIIGALAAAAVLPTIPKDREWKDERQAH